MTAIGEHGCALKMRFGGFPPGFPLTTPQRGSLKRKHPHVYTYLMGDLILHNHTRALIASHSRMSCQTYAWGLGFSNTSRIDSLIRRSFKTKIANTPVPSNADVLLLGETPNQSKHCPRPQLLPFDLQCPFTDTFWPLEKSSNHHFEGSPEAVCFVYILFLANHRSISRDPLRHFVFSPDVSDPKQT